MGGADAGCAKTLERRCPISLRSKTLERGQWSLVRSASRVQLLTDRTRLDIFSGINVLHHSAEFWRTESIA